LKNFIIFKNPKFLTVSKGVTILELLIFWIIHQTTVSRIKNKYLKEALHDKPRSDQLKKYGARKKAEYNCDCMW
jgi:hypothetical protein